MTDERLKAMERQVDRAKALTREIYELRRANNFDDLELLLKAEVFVQGREVMLAKKESEIESLLAPEPEPKHVDPGELGPPPDPLTEKLQHGTNCGGYLGSDDPCTSGLEWRIKLQTEQEMHAAWRKRAEESERDIDAVTNVLDICGIPRNCLGSDGEVSQLTILGRMREVQSRLVPQRMEPPPNPPGQDRFNNVMG